MGFYYKVALAVIAVLLLVIIVQLQMIVVPQGRVIRARSIILSNPHGPGKIVLTTHRGFACIDLRSGEQTPLALVVGAPGRPAVCMSDAYDDVRFLLELDEDGHPRISGWSPPPAAAQK